ncbi:hypothetical protein [Nocardia wallacei]|uniref:hypothetical protein n=1 Tax=Nocardia wallacei TaxID=480035 RepID=UPI002456CF9A|nr:hypothetical protein [Nocardia wallacei]
MGSVAVLAIMGLVYIPYTLDHARRGDTSGVVFGSAAVPMAASFVAAVVPHLKVRRRTLPATTRVAVVEGGRLELRSELRPWVRRLVGIWLLIGAMFLMVVVWGSMTDAAVTGDPVDIGWAVVGSAEPILLGMGCLAFVAYFLAGRRKRFYLALTPDAVVQRSGTVTQVLAWDDIAAIEPLTDHHVPKVRVSPKPLARVRVTGQRTLTDRLQRALLSGHIDLVPTGHGMDPALALHLVRFYLRRPEARAELASELAIARILRGEVG